MQRRSAQARRSRIHDMPNMAMVRPTLPMPSLSAFRDAALRVLANDGTWPLGDDHSVMITTMKDLATLVDIMERGVRIDDAIADEATRLARVIQNRFLRDHKAGLRIDSRIDATILCNPDAYPSGA